MFSHLRQCGEVLKSEATNNEEAGDFRGLFLASASLIESGTLITEALIENFCKLFPTLETIIDARKPLHSYGVDSLLTVELRNWLATEFSVDIPVFEILGDSKFSFSSVGLIVAERTEIKQNIKTSKPDE